MEEISDQISKLWQELYEEGEIETLREILRLDPEQGKTVRYGMILLHIASVRDEEDAEKLLELGAEVNSTDADGRTPLHRAAQARNPVTCKLLLKHGAIPDVTDNQGRTPSDCAELGDPWASQEEYEQTVQLLKDACEANDQ